MKNGEEVLNKCDVDGNGFIDLAEFVTATYDWKKFLTIEKI